MSIETIRRERYETRIRNRSRIVTGTKARTWTREEKVVLYTSVLSDSELCKVLKKGPNDKINKDKVRFQREHAIKAAMLYFGVPSEIACGLAGNSNGMPNDWVMQTVAKLIKANSFSARLLSLIFKKYLRLSRREIELVTRERRE